MHHSHAQLTDAQKAAVFFLQLPNSHGDFEEPSNNNRQIHPHIQNGLLPYVPYGTQEYSDKYDYLRPPRH